MIYLCLSWDFMQENCFPVNIFTQTFPCNNISLSNIKLVKTGDYENERKQHDKKSGET